MVFSLCRKVEFPEDHRDHGPTPAIFEGKAPRVNPKFVAAPPSALSPSKIELLARRQRAHQKFVHHREIVEGEPLFEGVIAPHAMNVLGWERPMHEDTP